MLVADFSNARVGDKVKCISGFTGVIVDVSDDKISVRWDKTKDQFSCDKSGRFYVEDAKQKSNPFYFYHFDTQFPTIEACKRPLPEIEVDDKVLVYQHGEWVNAYFSEFRGSYIATFLDGKTEWTNGIEAGRANNSFWKTADGKYDSGNLEEIE